MPAAKQKYYSVKDIAEILGVKPTKANQIMHMFEQRHQMFKDGNILRVRITDFDNWCEECTK